MDEKKNAFVSCGTIGHFPVLLDSETWNGWRIPYVDAEDAEAFALWTQREWAPSPVRFEFRDGKLYYVDDGADWELPLIDDGLYDVSCGLCWETYDF